MNWCCALQTVISDIEVEFEELSGRTLLQLPGRGDERIEFGVMHDVAYRLVEPVDGVSELIVSTTRPETIPADVALAIHPDDERYAALATGTRVVHPLNGEHIPVVRDAELVDREFGTGVVKVTPAHDAADYACGERHNLPSICMFDTSGRATAAAGAQFEGHDRLSLRAMVVAALRANGTHRGEREHAVRVPRCSRSGDVIEPLPMPQWFVRSSELARRTDAPNIVPAWHRAEWDRWLSSCTDWCVSRQLWWGHRVPAYTADGGASWVAAHSEAEARSRLGVAADAPLERDADVLDTWFAAALLPLSALGWPHNGDATALAPELAQYYPLALMETGSDILFFWAARMAMLCTHLAPDNSGPFRDLMLHAMVRDAKGRKMSKSLGNVVNPLHVQHGASLDELCRYMTSSAALSGANVLHFIPQQLTIILFFFFVGGLHCNYLHVFFHSRS